jgi:CrcB protein
MRRVVLVFVGGGIGSLLRAALLSLLAPGGSTAPVLLVNLVGAFMLGFVFVLTDETGLLEPTTRLFLVMGLLGGFTTFSTFVWGSALLVRGSTIGAAFDYLVASVGGGAVTVVTGLAAGRELVLILERGAVAMLSRLEARGLRQLVQIGQDVDMPDDEHGTPSRMISDQNHKESA